jgi:hypothetical protein
MAVIAQGQITIVDVNDGPQGPKGDPGATGATGKGVASIVEEYYLSSSSTAQSGGSWSTTVPAWVDGKYMWTRSVITYTDTTSTTTTPVCVTGAKGSTGSTGTGVSTVDVQYYLSTSSTSLVGGSWSTTAPTWVDGKYMWSKTVTTYTNGNTAESSAVCITGGKGSTGNSGSDAIIGVLSNEAQVLSADSSGNVLSYAGVNTTISIFKGTVDDSANWTYTYSTSYVQGSMTGRTFTVTALTQEIGYVDITATRSGYASLTKRFTLSKSKQGVKGTDGTNGVDGKDGVAYMGTTAPSNPATNGTWFQTDAAGNVLAIKKWTGSSWTTALMTTSAFSVAQLSALAADLGTITAGSITGVTMNLANGKFIVDSNGNVTFKGNLEGANGTFNGTVTVVKGQNKTMIYENIYNEYIDDMVSKLKYYMLVQNGVITLSKESLINSNYDTLTMDSSQIRFANNTYSTVFLSNSGGMLNVQGGIKSDKAMALLTPYTTFFTSMTGGWVGYGGTPTYSYPAYYQTADGIFHLTGVMKSGANGQFWVVPANLRPANKLAFDINCGNGFQSGYVTLDPSGVMSVFVPSGANVWAVLDGISWRAV